MTVAHVTDNRRAPLKVRKDDLYETPPEAVRALLDAEIVPLTVWEPACGPGAIVKVLRDSGRGVVATDLLDYGCPESFGGRDFLMELEAPPGTACIVTNPPFKLAPKFISHAVTLVPLVFMLLRFELYAARLGGLWDKHPPARVHAFSERLPMMHRHGWTGNKSTSRTNFAWFVWAHNHSGPTELHRVSWRHREKRPEVPRVVEQKPASALPLFKEDER